MLGRRPRALAAAALLLKVNPFSLRHSKEMIVRRHLALGS